MDLHKLCPRTGRALWNFNLHEGPELLFWWRICVQFLHGFSKANKTFYRYNLDPIGRVYWCVYAMLNEMSFLKVQSVDMHVLRDWRSHVWYLMVMFSYCLILHCSWPFTIMQLMFTSRRVQGVHAQVWSDLSTTRFYQPQKTLLLVGRKDLHTALWYSPSRGVPKLWLICQRKKLLYVGAASFFPNHLNDFLA